MRLAAVTVPSLSKAGLSFCIASIVEPWRIILVVRDDRVALAAGDREGHDLVLEAAGLLRGFRLVLRGDGEGILLFARQLPIMRATLSAVLPMW